MELTSPMHIRFDNDINTSNTVELDLLVLVCAPVAHSCHVCAAGFVFFVAFGEDDVFVEGGCELETALGFDPGVVVDWEGGGSAW